MFMTKPPPTNRKRKRDRLLKIPDRIAGLTLSLLKIVSDSHPASTVPSTPKMAEKAIT